MVCFCLGLISVCFWFALVCGCCVFAWFGFVCCLVLVFVVV